MTAASFKTIFAPRCCRRSRVGRCWSACFTWQQQQATSRQIADQLAVTRQGQVGERFSRAVGQLGSNSIDVRLGALYELEQLARPETEAPERRLAIVEIVAAYIREHARPAKPTEPVAPPPPEPVAPPPPQDVRAALSIVGRRSIEDGDPLVDLGRVNLANSNLNGANLRRADLVFADLQGADLIEADLRDAGLAEVDLRGADLTEADLRGADLLGADLRGADLDEADLRGANLDEADLRGANLDQALLGGALTSVLTQWPEGFPWQDAVVEQGP
jgi:hypothetical protein